MLGGRNNRFFFPWEQMFLLMQIIFIVLPSNMAAVLQNFYYCCLPREEQYLKAEVTFVQKMKKREKLFFSFATLNLNTTGCHVVSLTKQFETC